MPVATREIQRTFPKPHPRLPARPGAAAARIVRNAAWGIIGAAFLLAAGSGLYLVKSALGIDLLPGHSPLHDLLYDLVR
jgi:hypothetical protein